MMLSNRYHYSGSIIICRTCWMIATGLQLKAFNLVIFSIITFVVLYGFNGWIWGRFSSAF